MTSSLTPPLSLPLDTRYHHHTQPLDPFLPFLRYRRLISPLKSFFPPFLRRQEEPLSSTPNIRSPYRYHD